MGVFAEPSQSVESTVEEPELLDLDVTVPEVPPPEPTAAQAPPRERTHDHEPLDFDPTTIGSFEPTPETSELMPEVKGQAGGFESTEFTAPPAPVEQAPGLQTSYEVETGVHQVFFGALPGLDRPEAASGEEPSKLSTSSAFPELEEALPEDHGEVLPPHGDPIAETASAPAMAHRDESLLDFEMPVVEDSTAVPSRRADETPESAVSGSPDAGELPSLSSAIPAELPPEVIAAEAELTEAGVSASEADAIIARDDEAEPESVGSELSFIDVSESTVIEDRTEEVTSAAAAPEENAVDAREEAAEPSRAGARPFVTETMAELYLKQGFRQEALSVYEQLSASSPSDERLSARVVSLRAEIAAASEPSGPPVRDFFARIAARRPGERAAAAAPPSDSDFAPVESSAPVAPSAPPAAAPQGEQRPGGSIDALFGHRPIGSTEDSAASALAQAFGAADAGTEAPAITGNPTRQASGELTLDSVFREGGSRGPRNAQGFSFDQFFSQDVDGARTSGGGQSSQEVSGPGEPAERSEDDIEQFNSWLQGLKQR